MQVPTIPVTDGMRVIQINASDEAEFALKGWKQPEPPKQPKPPKK